jgi:hypothetical protein
LNKFRLKFNLTDETFNEIKLNMKYNNTQATSQLIDFIDSLPPPLRFSVSITMYKETFDNHNFFNGLRNMKLLTFLAQKFRPQFYQVD